MDRVLDDLAAALTAPHTRFRDRATEIAIRLAGNALTGLAIGLGIAAGLALAA